MHSKRRYRPIGRKAEIPLDVDLLDEVGSWVIAKQAMAPRSADA